MEKPKNERKSDQDLKTGRLAEALRANLAKRKALARSKKKKSGQGVEATEMPHTAVTEEGPDQESDGDTRDPLRSRPASD